MGVAHGRPWQASGGLKRTALAAQRKGVGPCAHRRRGAGRVGAGRGGWAASSSAKIGRRSGAQLSKSSVHLLAAEAERQGHLCGSITVHGGGWVVCTHGGRAEGSGQRQGRGLLGLGDVALDVPGVAQCPLCVGSHNTGHAVPSRKRTRTQARVQALPCSCTDCGACRGGGTLVAS